MFGWPLHAAPDWNPRSVMNFPMQANGAEMLRLACCLATERGLAVCAPVHDAILIEAPRADIEEHVAALQACMREASRRRARRARAGQRRQDRPLARPLHGQAGRGDVGHGHAAAGCGDRPRLCRHAA